MSSSIQAPSRSLLRALKSSQHRPRCECVRSKQLIQSQIHQARSLSSTLQRKEELPSSSSPPSSSSSSSASFQPLNDSTSAPRWSYTPAAMKAPVRSRAKPPNWQPFEVNGDPAKLDAMYARFLGRNGPKMLSDETKWLAVTHKSFDHGRRGFNDRLSFLGRQILELQTSLGMLSAADASSYVKSVEDPYGRQPFDHPATDNVEVLNGDGKYFFMNHKQLSRIASLYGLPEVVRWQPKNVNDISASGSDMVYAQALLAIVGALSLEQGGLVANKVARERVLQPIGLKGGLLESGSAPSTEPTHASAQEQIAT